MNDSEKPKKAKPSMNDSLRKLGDSLQELEDSFKRLHQFLGTVLDKNYAKHGQPFGSSDEGREIWGKYGQFTTKN